jgi:hypothetical protein
MNSATNGVSGSEISSRSWTRTFASSAESRSSRRSTRGSIASARASATRCVRCSPSARVTLVSARTAGAAATAGRMGYRHEADGVEEGADGLIVATRLRRRSWGMSYGRVEVTDAAGRRAWTNPLWYDEG